MNIYHYSLSIEADIEAEDLDEAWATIKNRMDDRFWGPTAANIELTEVKPETAEEAV